MKKLLLIVVLDFFLFCPFAVSALHTDGAESSSILLDFTRQVPAEQLINLLWTNDGLTQLHKNQEAVFVSQPQIINLNQADQFQTFATRLNLTNYDSTLLSVSVRFSADENGWKQWQLLKPYHEGMYSDTAWTSELLYLPLEIQYFQLMLEFHSSFSGLVSPRVKDLRIDFFSPGNMAPLNPEQVKNRFLPGANEDCGCPLPPIANRTDWNSPDGQNPSCSSPAYAPVTHMIVHHSYTNNTSSNWAATVLAIWDFHVNTNGWCDIGYNWLIDPNGVIYEGRGGGNNVRGAHFCAKNTATMGICMLGTYMDTVPTDAAISSLEQLLTWKSCDSGIDPMTSSLHDPSEKVLPHISGHRDGCNTLCPGDKLFNILPAIRSNVVDSLAMCDSLPATSVLPTIDLDVTIYPVPNQGTFFVDWNAERAERATFFLHNSLGKVIWQEEKQILHGLNTIELVQQPLASGTYILRLQSAVGMMSRKILIQH
ncbi:MAG: N-acetylmuramoyl-L-alanine amidase [Bacteroidota bacterium]